MLSPAGSIKRSLTLVTVCGLVILPADDALATSGEITRAEVNAEWTFAGIAGAIEWTEGCHGPELGEAPPGTEPPPVSSLCIWTPYATVGPAGPETGCSSADRVLGHLGDGVQLVWQDDARTGTGSASFDLADVALLAGAAAPLLCLSAVETRYEVVFCGWLGGWDCHGTVNNYKYQFDSTVLEAPIEDGDPPPGEPTEPPAPSPDLSTPAADPPVDVSPLAVGNPPAGDAAPIVRRAPCRRSGGKRREWLGKARISLGRRSGGKRCTAGHRGKHGARN